ncbi:hypothetical protein F4777DRAFT_519188 [Nemania sp. FL0916]|nr:hypothetical protein F4777DRAFT_519188 [Nemania sp. FL0916]
MTLKQDLEVVRRYEQGQIGDYELERDLVHYSKKTSIEFPHHQPTRSGPWSYDKDGIRYGYGYGCRLDSPEAICEAAENKYKVRPVKYWKAQFQMYGIRFHEGDDLRGVAISALDDGLFTSLTDEVKAIERRLAARYQKNKQKFVEELKTYCKEKAAWLKKQKNQTKSDRKGTKAATKSTRQEESGTAGPSGGANGLNGELNSSYIEANAHT